MGATQGAAVVRGERSRGAAVALGAVSLMSVLYLYFLFQLYNDPSLRELGFSTAADIQRYSVLVFALLFAILLIVRMRMFPAPAPGAAVAAAVPGGGGAIAGGAVIPSSGGARPRSSADDPAARPGAPASMSVPRVGAEELKGGWKRYRFPAERTGGLYVDTDIVVDGGTTFSDSQDAPRGRMILRVRDEVARVCVRCDLINHCHSKVAALITIDDMRGNSDCVAGLKRIATVKMESVKRARDAQAVAAADAAAAEAAAVSAPPEAAEEVAAPEVQAPELAPEPAPEAPAPDPNQGPESS